MSSKVEKIQQAIVLGQRIIRNKLSMANQYKKLGSELMEKQCFNEACELNKTLTGLQHELKAISYINNCQVSF